MEYIECIKPCIVLGLSIVPTHAEKHESVRPLPNPLTALARTRTEDGVRLVHGEDNEGDDVADRSHQSDASLTEFHMNAGICESRSGIAYKRG